MTTNIYMNKALSTEPPAKQTIKAVAQRWRINLKILHEDIPLQGSPERSLFRVVMEDMEGKYFILEQITAKSLERKSYIATTFDSLIPQQAPACSDISG